MLVEHQSSAEELMPLRVLKYQLAIIQKHIDTHKGTKLPIVVPIVFYNGIRSPYPHSTEIGKLFANAELYNEVQLGQFKLVDF